ncbi:MAG: ATPase, partial [Chitinophagaceae bacterium]|nr:ATPase [Chitinophagaceae bacterium]
MIPADTKEKIEWKVEGMTCSNCALTISKYLQKEGLKEVSVNVIDGDVSFIPGENGKQEKIKKGIEGLGYTVVDGQPTTVNRKRFLKTPLQKFWFCLPFTLILMLHMLPWHIHFLMNPWIQFALCLPVFVAGMQYFGTSAVKSIRNGVPNMNVLIAMGAAAAFSYSLLATLINLGEEHLYYESAATIITLVFLGYWMEDASIAATQKALKSLSAEQKVMANMIAFDDEHKEQIFPVENSQLRVGDLILIRTGEHVPSDCKILWGECSVNESLLTGESLPLEKHAKDKLIGGSIVENGTVKAQVTAVGKETILSKIVDLAKQAQSEKPPIQQLADKISAIFVPAVLIIAALTLAGNYFFFHIPFDKSLMRSIAVLVIACPCAMGLATPAAIAVGLGRAAKNGILFKDAKSLELFKNIQQIVFDKTGTLTTGEFQISEFKFQIINEEEFKLICYSLEKFSNHPIAKTITREWRTKDEIKWKKIEEIKGIGLTAIDNDGNKYSIGSYKMVGEDTGRGSLPQLVSPTVNVEKDHNIYLIKNNELLGWIDVKDEIRTEAKEVINYFKTKGIKTYLLSGDSKAKCAQLSNELGIDEFYAEQTPEQKLEIISRLNATSPTAMIGDGINDAAALAKATIGISLSDATEIARQNSQVVLMNRGLQNLPLALGLGRHTFITIKQNLFWAFFYNIIAIPIAAVGLLTPGFAALAMGFSDVVLAANSVR